MDGVTGGDQVIGEPSHFTLRSPWQLYKLLYMTTSRTYGGRMDVVTYSDARANLKGVMDRVVADRTQVVVTRQKAEAVVIVSLEDWNAMEETMHLLSTPANAVRLRDAIRQLDAGDGVERDLVERELAP
jgi:antitoxin YefM